MLLVNKLAISLREFVIEEFAKLLKVAVKSLFYVPAFYGVNWLVSHHGPSHDMWLGFLFAALFFASAPKKANSHPDKEEPKQPSAIILPASFRHGSGDSRV